MQREKPTRPRKLPKQERSRETVEDVLEATALVLKKEGYERATTRRVAEVAGVAVGSLYQYFPNKESLVVALYERHLAALISTFETAIDRWANAPLDRGVRGLVQAAVEMHAVDPELHRVLLEEVPRQGRPDPDGTLEARIFGTVQDFLSRHSDEIRPKDLALAAFVIVEAVASLTHAAVLHRPDLLNEKDLVDEATVLVLSYLSRN